METRSHAARLDQHDEALKILQHDVAEIKSIIQSLEADRSEEREFRKVMIAWMKQQDPEFSEFYSEWSCDGVLTLNSFSDTSDNIPGAPKVRKRELPENKSAVSASSRKSPIKLVSVMDDFDTFSGGVLNPISSGAREISPCARLHQPPSPPPGFENNLKDVSRDKSNKLLSLLRRDGVNLGGKILGAESSSINGANSRYLVEFTLGVERKATTNSAMHDPLDKLTSPPPPIPLPPPPPPPPLPPEIDEKNEGMHKRKMTKYKRTVSERLSPLIKVTAGFLGNHKNKFKKGSGPKFTYMGSWKLDQIDFSRKAKKKLGPDPDDPYNPKLVQSLTYPSTPGATLTNNEKSAIMEPPYASMAVYSLVVEVFQNSRPVQGWDTEVSLYLRKLQELQFQCLAELIMKFFLAPSLVSDAMAIEAGLSSSPKARTILADGAVRKGERVVPSSTLELLMGATFLAASSRIKVTERFEAVYTLLKEIALAVTPGSKAMQQLTHQFLPIAAKAAGQGNSVLASEAGNIFLWCLSQCPECYKQWDDIYLDNLEASIVVLRKLFDECKMYSVKRSSLDPLTTTLKSFKDKNEKALGSGNRAREALVKDADKYPKMILSKFSRDHHCLKATTFLTIIMVVDVADPGVWNLKELVDFDWSHTFTSLYHNRDKSWMWFVYQRTSVHLQGLDTSLSPLISTQYTFIRKNEWQVCNEVLHQFKLLFIFQESWIINTVQTPLKQVFVADVGVDMTKNYQDLVAKGAIRGKGGTTGDATWEDTLIIQSQIPVISLEDKTIFQGGSSDRDPELVGFNSNKSKELMVYSRRPKRVNGESG